MKNKSRFLEVCKEHISILTGKFALEDEKAQQYSWGEKFSMRNKTTGVIFTLEFQENDVLVRVCKLVRGSIVEPHGEITPDTQLFSFDLEDIVMLRAPEKVAPAMISKDDKIQRHPLDFLVARHVDNLQNYAPDILRGDFSLFEELDKVVKERAREAAFRKWGDAAVQFGWKK